MSRIKITKKERRNSGRVYPDLVIKGKKQEIIDDCLEPQRFWDDWVDRRDGMRDWYNDRKKIKKIPKAYCNDGEGYIKRMKQNIKLRLKGKIRKAQKNAKDNKEKVRTEICN